MLKVVLFEITLAWILSAIVYQVGSRIESGIITIADALIASFILIAVIAILMHKRAGVDECARCPYSGNCNK